MTATSLSCKVLGVPELIYLEFEESEPMARNKTFAFGTCTALLLTFLSGTAFAQEAAAPKATQTLPSIVVTQVENKPVIDRVVATGAIKAVEETYVSPQVDGLSIRTLNADVGDRVEADSTLVILNEDMLILQKSQYAASLAKANASLAQYQAQLAEAQANAEEAVRRAIAALKPGSFAYEMDDGAVIRVRIDVDAKARTAVVDFTGTSDQRPTNFNAPLSITRAATLYVFRTLVDDAIPLNEGCMKPITLIVPEGSMLNPRYPAAVVAGNVETSQAVVDTLYGALGVLAASQGTMNNFTFGDATRQYYETIAGGAGAGPDAPGADAVQSHMTNSRLTDPEVLETRFPVLLEEFSIRRGSGGAGAAKGGDGATRRVRFLEPMTAAILSNHRRIAPFGAAGGETGKVGVNRIERADGTVEILGSTSEGPMAPGDVFVIETPGGGGFGKG